ncbi:hypothetical protein CALCODRAFT_521599 [Calocera cornea HHB12733]|uniref:Uncharacterized protein n=1 Tax=Calocera cornea HHB12733 TaxID=1353952 RepID=A0A165CMF8_9BASI|nr:hypothetical protein CALCODRAFT_521599 [Calocera cornea HHB12733]
MAVRSIVYSRRPAGIKQHHINQNAQRRIRDCKIGAGSGSGAQFASPARVFANAQNDSPANFASIDRLSHLRIAPTTAGRRASKSPGPCLPILVSSTTGVLAAAVVLLAAAALPASAPASAPASVPARSPALAALAALAAAPSRLRTSIWRASASSKRGTVDHCRPPRLPPSRRAIPVGVRF